MYDLYIYTWAKNQKKIIRPEDSELQLKYSRVFYEKAKLIMRTLAGGLRPLEMLD